MKQQDGRPQAGMGRRVGYECWGEGPAAGPPATHVRPGKVDLGELQIGIFGVYCEEVGAWSNKQASDQ